jgi:hypothetical protein
VDSEGGVSDTNTVFLTGEYENCADALDALDNFQTANTSYSFYVVEALTSLPNPADS